MRTRKSFVPILLAITFAIAALISAPAALAQGGLGELHLGRHLGHEPAGNHLYFIQ